MFVDTMTTTVTATATDLSLPATFTSSIVSFALLQASYLFLHESNLHIALLYILHTMAKERGNQIHVKGVLEEEEKELCLRWTKLRFIMVVVYRSGAQAILPHHRRIRRRLQTPSEQL